MRRATSARSWVCSWAAVSSPHPALPPARQPACPACLCLAEACRLLPAAASPHRRRGLTLPCLAAPSTALPAVGRELDGARVELAAAQLQLGELAAEALAGRAVTAPVRPALQAVDLAMMLLFRRQSHPSCPTHRAARHLALSCSTCAPGPPPPPPTSGAECTISGCLPCAPFPLWQALELLEGEVERLEGEVARLRELVSALSRRQDASRPPWPQSRAPLTRVCTLPVLRPLLQRLPGPCIAGPGSRLDASLCRPPNTP